MKISLCQTAALGGRKFKCEDCGEVTYLYNSCVDRDCPQCRGARRADFSENATKRLIDGVVYYQVTMTLPSKLSELALFNRELFAKWLPKSAWSATRRCIESEQDYKAGAISVLHTWNQKLENHWHVHLLVPGAGPSSDGRSWVHATPPVNHHNSDGFYLVDADRLRDKFRSSFIRRLDRARSLGKLALRGRFAYLKDDENWWAFKSELNSKTWVAHIQPPPTKESVAQHVIRYLTRYVAGGPISDKRIVAADSCSVTFMAREGKRVGGERTQVPINLSYEEFIERWTQHIQPAGLTKVRHFGGWACNKVAEYQALCRELLLDVDELIASAIEHEQEDEFYVPDIVCEHCGSDRLVLAERTCKPSWRDVLGYQSDAAPLWYTDARDEGDRRFWDGAMGEGFNDWYLETFIESAKGREATESPPEQLSLRGFESIGSDSSYLLNSF